jgi:hypothetical protein
MWNSDLFEGLKGHARSIERPNYVVFNLKCKISIENNDHRDSGVSA